MCFKTQMTALESVLNASIQIEDNRKSKKKYSFRFNNNQVCKHVELHRSSLPVNFRFFRCGLIKRRCESDPICHGLSVILYKLPDIKVFYWFPAISAQELKLSCIFLPWFFFPFWKIFCTYMISTFNVKICAIRIFWTFEKKLWKTHVCHYEKRKNLVGKGWCYNK